jgi:hypothetical protein
MRSMRTPEPRVAVFFASLAYPPYNIETTGEDVYRLTMAGRGDENNPSLRECMIPMCIGAATFQASAVEKPKGRHHKPHWPLRGALRHEAIVPPQHSRGQLIAEQGIFKTLRRRSGGTGNTVVRSTPKRRLSKRGLDKTMEKPASTWSFDQGILTVHYLGKTVSLGRYATHEFAANAAAVYFAKHQARKKRSALRPASFAARMLSQK